MICATTTSGGNPRRVRGAHRRLLRCPAVVLSAAFAAAFALLAASPAPRPDVAAELRLRVAGLRQGSPVDVAGARVAADPRLADLYERRGFAPVWDGARAEALLVAVRGAAGHGLDPAHYHLAALEARRDEGEPPAARADLDLARSDALSRLAHDLRYGHVAPAERDPPAAGEPDGGEVDLEALVIAADLAAALDALAPGHYAYRGLRRALARYREVRDAGGFPAVDDGPSLRRAEVDPRVPALRRRLLATGDLAPADALDSEVFDTAVERAVRRFQHRHGLNEDGVVGRSTLAEMRVPVERRIEQVRVNLERARWVLHGLPSSFIVVNVAGQRLYVVREGSVAWETRVVVGRTVTRTPTFSAALSEVVLNPTWAVPASIAPEVVADVLRDPDYLARLGFRVLDAAGGEVGAAEVERALAEGGRFPYRFLQTPGPVNALGEVKLVFPNPYGVYLHDTPARSHFAREDRFFSHGCIRVEEPLRLAELVLDDPAWDRRALAAAVAAGTTRTLRPSHPLPVLVLYWTAAADLHDELHLYRDVYRRDAALLAALDRP